MKIDDITSEIIDSAIELHRQLGPGLLKSAYEECLAFELQESGFNIERQKALPVRYKKIQLKVSYQLDLVVENMVIIELKSVECVLPIHIAQLLSCLKLSQLQVGLLINFSAPQLKDGIKRVVNEYKG